MMRDKMSRTGLVLAVILLQFGFIACRATDRRSDKAPSSEWMDPYNMLPQSWSTSPIFQALYPSRYVAPPWNPDRIGLPYSRTWSPTNEMIAALGSEFIRQLVAVLPPTGRARGETGDECCCDKGQYPKPSNTKSSTASKAFIINKPPPVNMLESFGWSNKLTTKGMTRPLEPTTTVSPIKTSPHHPLIGCNILIRQKNITWESPNSFDSDPTPIGSSCTMSIALENEDDPSICQIRLDFERFHIGQPNEDGECSDDRFSVINTEGKVPVICGDNDDHHMYLKTSSAERVQLRFSFGKPSVPPGTRKWKIKITLLPCCASDLAPTDCLQYFKDYRGVVKSFNWLENDHDREDSPISNKQLANQEYNVCFKAENPTTSICFTPCNGRKDYISPKNEDDENEEKNDLCPPNYFLVARDLDSEDEDNHHICGSGNDGNRTALCSDVTPFNVHYAITKGEEEADTNHMNGFCLEFKQKLK